MIVGKNCLPMPLDRLSEQERLRLAQLIKAPLAPAEDPPQTPVEIHWPKWNGSALSTAKRHLTAHWRLWVTASATALAVFLLLTIAVQLAARPDREAVQLQVRETQGQLHIRWDTQSDLVRHATGAKLFITDGPARLFVNLDSGHLRRGMVTYARQTGRVELRMALTEPDGRTIDQNAVFFGPPPPDENPQEVSAAGAPTAPTPPAAVDAKPPIEPVDRIEHRSRRKPLVQSGTSLPFTCAAGDVFHKTDAPPGWNTFTCQGKNVWSIAPSQAGANSALLDSKNANRHM